MNSIDYPLPPSQLLCPNIRLQDRKIPFRSKQYGKIWYEIIENSCYLSDAREEDKNSSHSHQLNLLFWCNNKQGRENDFLCWACWEYTVGTIYYFCNKCYEGYHKECVDSPSVFISSYNPKYPFHLVKLWGNDSKKELLCYSCGIPPKKLAYYSSIYDLALDPVCANKREIPPINNRKRHEHTLYYFPRKASLICDVCGTDGNKICFYSCFQCDFVVHLTCIDLPHVIHTSRHSHRLFYTSSLSPETILSCGVCRQEIDGSYGEYSCSKGCAYAVHSKCAMQLDVCDGKELEDEPEKEYNDIKMYEEIGDGIIRHFSHPYHTIKFDRDIGESYYEKKQCEACLLPFYSGSSIYRCMQCDFVLHGACVYLPSIKQCMVHAHEFVLKLDNSKHFVKCDLCDRFSFGFKYMCREGCDISLDIRCASLSEPVHHPSHQHPLFLTDTRKFLKCCSICGIQPYLCINCVTCEFALCFCCATLPYKVNHEDDEHWLTLSYENNTIYPYWCQICEENMDPPKGYYTCRKCGTTFHIPCIIGNDPYMKPRTWNIIPNDSMSIDVIPNDRLIRPICNYCRRRCPYKLAFKIWGRIFCSYIHTYTYYDK